VRLRNSFVNAIHKWCLEKIELQNINVTDNIDRRRQTIEGVFDGLCNHGCNLSDANADAKRTLHMLSCNYCYFRVSRSLAEINRTVATPA
jgi:hypothetical protein